MRQAAISGRMLEPVMRLPFSFEVQMTRVSSSSLTGRPTTPAM